MLEDVLFADLPRVRAAQPSAPRLSYDGETVHRANALLRGADIEWPANRYEARAQKRAALAYLREHHPRSTWPQPVVREWKLLFRRDWQLSENGRGRKDLMRCLKLDPRDAAQAEWLLAWLDEL